MLVLPAFVYDMVYIPYNKESVPIINEIKSAFTYKNPDYYKKKRLNFYINESEKYINNYVYRDYLDYQCIAIPRGGMSKLRTIEENENIYFQFIDHRLSVSPVTHLKNNVVLREDQKILVKSMLKFENCLIRSPQSSGKTEVALKFIEYTLKNSGPVLVIVWQSDLIDQWINRASKRYNIPKSYIGIIQGAKRQIKPITIGMQQTVKNHINKFFDKFGTVICDEVQRFGAKTFNDVINHFPSRYRIGISADETRVDKKEFYIYDAFGKIGSEIKKKQLIDRGAIHEVIIRLIPTEYDFFIDDIPYAEVSDPRKKKNPEMINNMITNKDRNDLIWKFMLPILRSGEPSVIMSQRVQQVLDIDKKLISNGFISGKVLGSKDYKNEAKITIDMANKKKLQVVVGTIPIKLGQGVDVPSWTRGFLLTPVNKRQPLQQITGRLTRPSEGKEDAVMYIFWDKNIYPYFPNQIKKWYRYVFCYNYKEKGFVKI